jgi:hypothetical protein
MPRTWQSCVTFILDNLPTSTCREEDCFRGVISLKINKFIVTSERGCYFTVNLTWFEKILDTREEGKRKLTSGDDVLLRLRSGVQPYLKYDSNRTVHHTRTHF